MKCCTGVTQRMISSTAVFSRSGLLLQLLQLIRIFDQRAQSAGDRGACRVVAGGRDDDVVGGGFDRAERTAVDLAVGDHGRKILAGMGAAFFGHLVEVAEEVGDHVGVRIALLALHVGIAAAEQFLRQLAACAARRSPARP